MPGGSVQREWELQHASVFAFLFTLEQSPDMESAGSMGLSHTVSNPTVAAHYLSAGPEVTKKASLFMNYSQGKSFVDVKEYLWD